MRLLPIVAVVAAVAVAGDAWGQVDAIDSMQVQGSSVGDGASRQAPAFAADVRRAARLARCQLHGSPGSRSGVATGRIRYREAPATAGRHHARWADWGFYDKVVRARYAVHNLRRGGVVVSLGRAGLRSRQAGRLVRFFAEEPGFLLIAPRESRRVRPRSSGRRRFPERGFIVTSWQRRMVCRNATPRAMEALEVYARRYRGTGPLQVPPINSTDPRPRDLPAVQAPGDETAAVG